MKKEIIRLLKNSCLPLLRELRDEAGLTENEKKLFEQRYIKDNFVENVKLKVCCSNSKYYKDHDRILNKIESYLNYQEKIKNN